MTWKCCLYEKEMGLTEFTIFDENFLKDKKRALELVALMERNNKHFTFFILTFHIF